MEHVIDEHALLPFSDFRLRPGPGLTDDRKLSSPSASVVVTMAGSATNTSTPQVTRSSFLFSSHEECKLISFFICKATLPQIATHLTAPSSSALRATPLLRVKAKITVKNTICMSLRLAAYGEFDCDFDFDSQERSCSKYIIPASHRPLSHPYTPLHAGLSASLPPVVLPRHPTGLGWRRPRAKRHCNHPPARLGARLQVIRDSKTDSTGWFVGRSSVAH